MSAPVRNDDANNLTPSMFPATMYAPPWAREGSRDTAGDAGMAAVDKALNASEDLRRTLPPAAPMPPADGKRRWRDKPFDGDIAARHLRERPSLDPVAVPAPPMPERGSAVGVLARVTGAVGLAALAASFVVGAMPQPLQGAANKDAAVTKPFWSRLFGAPAPEQPPAASPLAISPRAIIPQPVMTERIVVPMEPAAFADRLAGAPIKAETEPMVSARAIQIEQPVWPQPSVRTLDREELAMLLKRSEELITQGDIASARLVLTRAAEAGDARAALALGATFDAGVLRKLGVLGGFGDVEQARAWYAKAAEYGSGEATRRLEVLAQGR
jgi:hypothetical protein